MKWTDCTLIAFDTETTGLQAYDGDRIIEFGAVELKVGSDLEVTDVVHHQFMINPGIPIPREATNVSGIRDEDVVDSPHFSEVADEIWSLLSDSILIAHNFGFDLGFLRTEFELCSRTWPTTLAEIDTLPLAKRLMTQLKSRRLEKVAAELNVSLENAHRAVDDAEACGRVFVGMAQRYDAPPLLEDLVEWAVAVGPPPETGHIAVQHQGGPEFLFGPHRGMTIEQQPDYLQWMIIAKEYSNNQWRFRFPDSLRQWANRWLRARAAGRADGAARSSGRRDWGLDPTPWRSGLWKAKQPLRKQDESEPESSDKASAPSHWGLDNY